MELLSRAEAEEYLGNISRQSLLRLVRDGLPQVRLRGNLVRYRRSDLDKLIADSTVTRGGS